MTKIIKEAIGELARAENSISAEVPNLRECMLEIGTRRHSPKRTPPGCERPQPTYLKSALTAGASALIWGPPSFVLPTEGNAIRAVVTFRRVLDTYSFLSVKNRRTQLGEGVNEFHALQALEVATGVVDYQCQPFSIRWETSEGPRAYTPDVVVAFADGSVEAQEVKADWSYFHDPEYAEKIAYARTALAGIDVGFRKVVPQELERPRIAAFNIARVFNNRFTRVLPADEQAVADALACRGGEAPLGTIEETLHPDPRIARAKADAMLCRRRIVFSLTAPVTGETVVTAPIPPLGHARDIRRIGL